MFTDGHPKDASLGDKKFIQKFERGLPRPRAEWGRKKSQVSANKSPYLRNCAR